MDDDRAALTAEFQRVMLAGTARMKREFGYNPTRFQRMVAEKGAVGAAKQLLADRSTTSDGFTTLWENNHLGLSVEAHALLPRFKMLFTTEELGHARHHHELHDFDVDGFLRNIGDDLP